MNKTEFMEALELVVAEKGIDKEVIFKTIEESLLHACEKHFSNNQNFKVVIDRVTGEVSCYEQRTIVEVVKDESNEIELLKAQVVNPNYSMGDIIDLEVTPRDFGRISAQAAKQVVVQKFREVERENLYNEYINKEREVITGLIQRNDRRNVIVKMGKLDAILAPNEQIAGEEYIFDSRVKVYVLEVKQTTKGPQVFVSRTHPELVKRLFEQEVPEVFEGTVEIKSIAREAGNRTKIAVYSKDSEVDALGACVGQNGSRVNIIVEELRGEKIDVITWSEDPKEFISAALSPSKVIGVALNMEEQSAKIVVPDHQLSLAIGKEGQNARLSAKLTGWKIDIKSETQAKEIDFLAEGDILCSTPKTEVKDEDEDMFDTLEDVEAEDLVLESDDENDDFDAIDDLDTIDDLDDETDNSNNEANDNSDTIDELDDDYNI